MLGASGEKVNAAAVIQPEREAFACGHHITVIGQVRRSNVKTYVHQENTRAPVAARALVR